MVRIEGGLHPSAQPAGTPPNVVNEMKGQLGQAAGWLNEAFKIINDNEKNGLGLGTPLYNKVVQDFTEANDCINEFKDNPLINAKSDYQWGNADGFKGGSTQQVLAQITAWVSSAQDMMEKWAGDGGDLSNNCLNDLAHAAKWLENLQANPSSWVK